MGIFCAGRRRRTHWLPLLSVLILGAALLAGCVDGEDPEGEDPGANDPPADNDRQSGMKPLSALTECKGTYRDSQTPLRCGQEIGRLEPIDDFPLDSWSCISGAKSNTNEQGVRVYENSSGDGHVLHYWSPYHVDVLGIVGITSGSTGEREYLAWNDGNLSSTLVLPRLEEGDLVDVLIFTAVVNANDPRFDDAVVRANWTLHEGKPYPVRILVIGGQDHYLVYAANMPEDEVFPYQWGPVNAHYGDDMEMYGADYHILVQHYEHLRETLEIPDDGSGC